MSKIDLRQEEEQILTPFWGFVVKYGIAVVLLIFYGTAVLHFSYTPDDTYIYLQYAKNLARGDGFSFNAGTPSYGVTGPLWTLLITLGAKLGLDPYIVAKTFDLLFASIAILVLYVLAFFIIKDKIYAFFAAWIFSFDAWFLRWSGSGMESSFAVLLSILVVYYAYRNDYLVASLVAGILTLVRPEGALLFAIVLADNTLNSNDRSLAWKSVLISLGMFAVVLFPWVVFSFIHFGSIVPNTLLAKTSAGLSLASMWFVFLSSVKIIGATQAALLLALSLGIWVTFRKKRLILIRTEMFPILWTVALPLSYTVLEVQVISRYLLLATPFIVLYGVWGIKQLELASHLSPKQVVVALSVVTAVALAQNQYVYRTLVVPHMEQFELGMEDCLKPIAYWLKSNTEPNATVLTPDVGLLGYVSDRTMFDTAGLVTPSVKRAFNRSSLTEGMLERLYEKVVHPHYIVDKSTEPERLASSSFVPVMTRLFPSLSLTKPGPVFYTLYKVRN